MVTRGVKTFIDNFDRAQSFSTTPGMNGWTIKDTSSSGTPTYAIVDGGAKLTLASTSEAEVVTLYHNDVLVYDARYIKQLWFTLLVAGIDAVTALTFGIGSAQNDTDDSVATNAWFRMQGSVSTTNIVVETDDATTDNDDKATGQTLAATYKKCLIDFTNGLQDVRFFIDGARVAANGGATAHDGRFDMSALTAGLNVQPWVQLSKASGTGVPSVTIGQFGIQAEWNY
jgi:hypothetical protein